MLRSDGATVSDTRAGVRAERCLQTQSPRVPFNDTPRNWGLRPLRTGSEGIDTTSRRHKMVIVCMASDAAYGVDSGQADTGFLELK